MLSIIGVSFTCSILYACMFMRSRALAPHAHRTLSQWRTRFIGSMLVRLLFIALLCWYLLRLSIAGRILFLGVFISSFWCIVLLAQRRYYGNN